MAIWGMNRGEGDLDLRRRRRPEATYYSSQQSLCMRESFVLDPLSVANERCCMFGVGMLMATANGVEWETITTKDGGNR